MSEREGAAVIAYDRLAVERDFADPHGPAALFASMQRSNDAKRARHADVDWEGLREQARAIKVFAIANLGELLRRFEREFQARGGTVLWARTGEEAAGAFLDICKRHGAAMVVKGKSMVSEEMELNARLERAGIEPVETDLGEFIVQLAGQRPSHIIGPAVHLSRQEIGALFARELQVPYDDDPAALSEIARRLIRRKYLEAGIGMTGANFAVAETGTIVVVENEGNGGLSAMAPPVHVAVMGIEKVIPRLDDLIVFLHLLARAATGQKLSAYTHLFLGPAAGRSAYCIIVDAGRTGVLADEHVRSALHCIRCGACMNVCPIYRRAGGWAYGWVYPGPIGSVLTPAMVGIDKAGELPFASTLCGACRDECPVKIDLPNQLVHLRSEAVEHGGHASRVERFAVGVWANAMRSSTAYRRAVGAARAGRSIAKLFPWLIKPLRAWTRERELPHVARQTFRDWWASR